MENERCAGKTHRVCQASEKRGPKRARPTTLLDSPVQRSPAARRVTVAGGRRSARFSAMWTRNSSCGTFCHIATVLAAPRPVLLLRAQGNGSRVVTEDPGRVSAIAQEAVFGGDPLHLGDARHAGRLIEGESRRVQIG